MNQLNFKPVTLQDIHIIKPYFKHNLSHITDWTVGGVFLWRDLYHIDYAFFCDALILKVKYLGKYTAFSVLCNGMCKEIMGAIKSYCKKEEESIILCLVDDNSLTYLKENEDILFIKEERSYFDYLYDTKDLQEFKGKKYQTQRNHVNKFLKYEPKIKIWNGKNKEEVISFLDYYYSSIDFNNKLLEEEKHKIYEVIRNHEAYQFEGILVYVDDKLIGLALGEVIDDCAYEHIEKALDEYQGIYPYIVQQYALMHNKDKVKYINREDDNGDEGLRYSKNKYRPIKLLSKYTVEVNND